MAERAVRDLQGVRNYSVEQFGPRVTSEYLAKFNQSMDSIRVSPGLLRARPEVSGRLLFHRVDQHWMICDRIEGAVYVLAIMHAAMNMHERIALLEPTLINEAELLHRSIVGHPPGHPPRS
jgi:plasmid stabilization system protein ParE